MKSKRVLISMREDLLKMVDEIAEKESRSRSSLIRQALRVYFNTNVTTPQPVDNVNESESIDPFASVVMR